MANLDVKKKIITSLGSFSTGQLSANALNLFQTLGYSTERQAPFDKPNYATFKDSFVVTQSKFREEKALVKDWGHVDLLFQLSKEEVRKQISLFDTKKVDSTIIETYLFFAIALSQDQYSRTELSNITREVNHLFPMPVMILFNYGKYLTLSVINRRQHKRDESKDVLEKITLIKDINFENPHRAHVEILFDLSFDELKSKHGFTNFVELHNAWQKTLDTKELNKHFFQKLANWYFWATDYVSFPDDMEKDENIRNATSLIRLITRIIFIWFIKEKSLVPEALFDRKELDRILKEFAKNRKSNSYYRAILQNLFFGTLNQNVNERGFAKEGSFEENKTNYGVKNLFRYANHFTVSEKEALSLFKDIPFLNGGLFDCLDKENDDGKVLYSDGFSRNPKKQALVPDFLFFGAEEEYDLNAIYGTKNKRYTVKGLINILSDYKFTVAENTPVEEEVALDPELLGKVFENLLASYNPETRTSARKQTGSFYTPREIVNYMVDESLKAYLRQALSDKLGIKAEDADTGLEILFSYTEREHAFTHDETKVLIQAIDACKILDPACGSGAFPMGILHKLVHILHKLDAQNEQWKERQVHKARQIDDPAIRDNLIADIESAFENNELDYGRKLYLIENCLYGADIQPIAVQIAKLRFFISLVVDQKKEPGKENFGIRSLPNLETKFVAANTLIGLEKPITGSQLGFKNPEITELENELKELRHRYFSAKTRKDKMACQKEDKAFRQKIAILLMKDGWAQESAKQIVAFDPYDQNARSPFFDPEWMFGINDKFDVLIENPPYGAELPEKQKDYLKKRHVNIVERIRNSFLYFMGESYNLAKDGGVICMILPNEFLFQIYMTKARKFFLENARFLFAINVGEDVFEAIVPTCVLAFVREKIENYSIPVADLRHANLEALPELLVTEKFTRTSNRSILNAPNAIFSFDMKISSLINRLAANFTPFENYCDDVANGISTSCDEVYIVSADLAESENFEREYLKECIRGGQFNRFYCPTHTNDFVLYINSDFKPKSAKNIYQYLQKHKDLLIRKSVEKRTGNREWHILFRSRYEGLFIKPKILFRQTGDKIIACVDNTTGYYCINSVNVGLIKEKYHKNVDFILGLLNSRLVNFYYQQISQEAGRVLAEVKPQRIRILPICEGTASEQLQITKIVKYVVFLSKNKNTDIVSGTPNKIAINEFERIIDAMVYELYLPDEIKAVDAEVLKHLTKLPELKDDWSDAQKLQTIEKAYKELSIPNHPVSVAMFKMDTIEEIRIIEGKQ